MIAYNKIWPLLKEKGITKTDLRKEMSSATVAKLTKNEKVSIDVIEKLCELLECQPGDFLEYVSDKKIEEAKKQLEQLEGLMQQAIKARGLTEEEFKQEFQEEMNALFKKLAEGDAFQK